MKDDDVKIKAISDKDGMQMSAKEKKGKKSHRKTKSCFLLLLVIIISFVIGGLGGLIFDNVLFDYLSQVPWLAESKFLQVRESQVVIQREEKITTTTTKAVNNLVRDVNASVVSIMKKTTTLAGETYITPQVDGYGFILTADGLIVSSGQVLSGQPEQYEVVSSDGSTYDIEKVIKDPLNEIVFIKVQADNLSVAKLAGSDDLQTGQVVHSIFSNSLGKVEVKSITIEGVEYNPTFPLNSDRVEYYFKGDVANLRYGSALFTIGGEIVGLVVSGEQDDQLIYQAGDIESALREVVAQEKITYPVIGISYVKLNSKLAQMNGLSVNDGLLIYNLAGQAAVRSGSSAATAGLRANDIITSIGGKKINGNYSLFKEARQWNKDEEVEVKYLRDGQENSTRIVINEIKEAE